MKRRSASATRRRVPALAAVLAAVALLATACTGKDAVDQTAAGQYRFVSGTGLGTTISVADRKTVPDFSSALLDGGSIKLSQDAGKVVVINFWATWCGPCTTETPQFDSVYRTYKDKGVAFLGVDTKETSRDAAKAFVKDNQISYPIAWDEQAQTAVALGKIPALSLPFTVLLDKHRRVAAVYLQTLTPKDLQPVLDRLLTES
jgi:peroxiredoxin